VIGGAVVDRFREVLGQRGRVVGHRTDRFGSLASVGWDGGKGCWHCDGFPGVTPKRPGR
jgi:hypothetical protein